jgi:PEP-CTERM motif
VPGSSITYTIALADLGSFTDLGLSWNMTCGNDTIQGDYSVPEPGTIGLLSLGLLGVGFASRRRKAIA